ncbi:MAG: methionine--tRNA ligase [Candidatus Pacebacteria bacterium]|nr:methionine--tRNA ligase [Candidatus Paceibacterota bacterium]
MSTNRYITTTLPYVNADPHIGFALEIVQADTLARFWRHMDDEVFFNTGTDEHGQKIAQKADEVGQDRQAYVDHYAGEFSKLKEALDLSYDNFIRTTDEHHTKAAQHIWNLCDESGDIYKKKYKGLYCVGCESFKTESDLVDGKCPDHRVEPQEIEEENYFFKLSAYQEYLTEYLTREDSVVPDFRRKELLKFIEDGLEDLSISREKSRMDWGIPVPGDAEHVMYVWFDALTNYISTLGWPEDVGGNFKKFWEDGKTLQVAGKDQLRFQSIIWQAMLKSAGIKATDTVFYHGFINSGGQKMSKSLGNVISPYEMVERYGTDAARYILLRHVHPTDDSDLTGEKMDELYEAHLVNGLGNVVARVMKLAETHLAEAVQVEDIADKQIVRMRLNEALSSYQFNHAIDEIWKDIADLDDDITVREPFKVIKSDTEMGQRIIEEQVKSLRNIGLLISAIMPKTSEKILAAIKENKKPENLFPRLEK